MRRFAIPFRIAVLLALALRASGADPSDTMGFDGLWAGEVIGPNARTSFGVAVTPTPRGRLVSVDFPEMFLFSANFGVAAIAGDTLRMPALELVLQRDGDRLNGALGPAALRVELRRNDHAGFRGKPELAGLPPGPKPLWTRVLGAAAWASPIAADQTIYVGTVDGRMHALSLDGRETWTWVGPHPLYGTALATLDALYFVDATNELVALSRADGRLRWRTPLRRNLATGPAPMTDPTQNHRTATPVADAKGVLYVGSDDGGLCAIRARTGKLLWRFELNTPIFASATAAGDDLWTAGFDGTVVRLNRRTHKELLRKKLGGAIVSAPVIAGDRVILGARDGMLYGIEAANGAVAWRDTCWFSWVESEPRLLDGVLYVGSSDYRRLSALDPVSGAIRWTTDVRGLCWGSPVVDGDTVYAATAGQTMSDAYIDHHGGVVALDRVTGAVKWRHAADSPTEPLSGFAGSLVLAGGQLVGASLGGTLIAFPTRD